MRFFAAACLLALTFIPQPAKASLNRIAAQVLLEKPQAQPGEAIRVAIHMSPAPGWHGYWINPGDSGLPPKVVWTLPDGVKAGGLQHPAPIAKEMAGFVSYIHPGAFTLLTNLEIPRSARPGSRLPIQAHISWLACSATMCMPEQTDIALDLRIASEHEHSVRSSNFDEYEAEIPVAIPSLGEMENTTAGIQIDVKAPARISAESAKLYPITKGVFDPSDKPIVKREGDHLIFTLPKTDSKLPRTFKAVINSGPGSPSYVVTAKLKPTPSLIVAAPKASHPAQADMRDLDPNKDAVRPSRPKPAVKSLMSSRSHTSLTAPADLEAPALPATKLKTPPGREMPGMFCITLGITLALLAIGCIPVLRRKLPSLRS